MAWPTLVKVVLALVCSDADHNDEGQHHGVLDCRRAVFVDEEIHDVLLEAAHGFSPSFGGSYQVIESVQLFGNLATSERPMALRPRLTTGLPFRR
jgi:hypothetical protein